MSRNMVGMLPALIRALFQPMTQIPGQIISILLPEEFQTEGAH